MLLFGIQWWTESHQSAEAASHIASFVSRRQSQLKKKVNQIKHLGKKIHPNLASFEEA
jgi:hypothetical protein